VKGVLTLNPRFHLQFNYLMPVASMGIPNERMQSWGWQQFFTYVKIKKGTDLNTLQSRFQAEARQKEEIFNKDRKAEIKPVFQRLKDIHLYSSNFKFDMAQHGNIMYVNALIIIASIILIIACFNFINLSTAKSLQRAREVGIRKAIGAERQQLIAQFMGETLLFALVSTALAVMLALFTLPWLNHFTEKNIVPSLFL